MYVAYFQIYYGTALLTRDGVQTISCSEEDRSEIIFPMPIQVYYYIFFPPFLYNIIHSAPDNHLVRVECVVQEYPPQTTTSGLGNAIVSFITQSPLFSAEMVVQSGKREREKERERDRERQRQRESERERKRERDREREKERETERERQRE